MRYVCYGRLFCRFYLLKRNICNLYAEFVGKRKQAFERFGEMLFRQMRLSMKDFRLEILFCFVKQMFQFVDRKLF